MGKTKLFSVIAVAAIIVGGVWLLSGNSSPTQPPQASNPGPSSVPSDSASAGMSALSQNNTSASPVQAAPPEEASLIPSLDPGSAASSVKEFTVTAKNYSFTPSTLTVKKGDTVKITLDNADGFHDFRIDEFNVATKKIKGGTQDSVQFVVDKTGSFEYYCSVGNHRAMGMKGTLVVE